MKIPAKSVLIGVSWTASLAAAMWAGKEFFGSNAAALSSATAVRQPAADRQSPAGLQLPGAPGSATTRAAAAEALANGEAGGTAAADRRSIADRAKDAFSSNNPVEKMAAFLKLLAGLQTNEDRLDALKVMMDGADPRGRGREYAMLIYDWAKNDPVAALEYTKTADDWKGRWGANTVMQTWIQQDPDAAIAWAKANGPKDPKDDQGNWYIAGAISALAKTDLERASALALEQPPSRARGEMMDKLLDAYTKKEGTAAQDWVATLPQGPFRDGATQRLASRLAEKDPQASVAFVEQQPSGGWKANAYNEIVDNWAGKDPNAAGAWLGTYPPGPETDEPRKTFAWKIREQDPESAMAWAGTISDPHRRDRTMVQLARDWFKREPKAAQSFIDRQGWPQDVRGRIMN